MTSYTDDYVNVGRLRLADLQNQLAQEKNNLHSYVAQYQASNRTDVDAARSAGVTESNIALITKEIAALNELGGRHTYRP